MANEIFSYPSPAIEMFADELEIELPTKPEVISIAAGIINWHEKCEYSKKALTLKLIELDACWKEKVGNNQHIYIPGQENVKFKSCAKRLDIHGKLFVLYI